MKTLKPRVFIGCSLEAKPIAAAVHENLRFSAEVTPWYSGVFNPSSYTMDDLETEVRTTDFAILFFIRMIYPKFAGSTMHLSGIIQCWKWVCLWAVWDESVFFILPEDITTSRMLQNRGLAYAY